MPAEVAPDFVGAPSGLRLPDGLHPIEGVSMKIVGFEGSGGLRLGVVEGDQVIDLQQVDQSIPSDLGEVCRRNNDVLSPLMDAGKSATSCARRPLAWYIYGIADS